MKLGSCCNRDEFMDPYRDHQHFLSFSLGLRKLIRRGSVKWVSVKWVDVRWVGVKFVGVKMLSGKWASSMLDLQIT